MRSIPRWFTRRGAAIPVKCASSAHNVRFLLALDMILRCSSPISHLRSQCELRKRCDFKHP
eukprot:6186267-Pleurochrysis_carterae.AAC.3